jgi:hypothetical protein
MRSIRTGSARQAPRPGDTWRSFSASPPACPGSKAMAATADAEKADAALLGFFDEHLR